MHVGQNMNHGLDLRLAICLFLNLRLDIGLELDLGLCHYQEHGQKVYENHI